MLQFSRLLITGLYAAILLATTLLATMAMAITPVMAQDAPYNLEKFRSVLDDSKLQAPTSSPTLIKRGDFAGASNKYFFLDKTGQYMTFTVDGKSNRSELRQSTGEWDTATKTPQRMIGRVHVFVPEDQGLEQITFMQIHDKRNGDKGLNKPLLRLTRRGDYRGKQDHLWAHIRTPRNSNEPISLENLGTENIDLGPRPESFFDAEVRVQKSQLIVIINGQTMVDMDVSYWDGLDNYFKAGVYNQNNGRSKVQFETLRFSDSP